MKILHAINRAKQGADALLDPSLGLAIYNLGVLEGTYRAIETGEPVKAAAGAFAGGLALTLGNVALTAGIKDYLGPLSKLSLRASEAYKEGKSADWKNWLKTAVLAGALTLGVHNADINQKNHEEPRGIPLTEVCAPLEDIVEGRETPLLGKVVVPGTYYSYFTGIEGVFENIESLKPNSEVLENAWNKKFEVYSKTGAKAHLYDEEVKKFDEATNNRISLVDYITEFDEIIDNINSNLDWEAMKGKHIWGKHKEQKMRILQSYASRVSAEDFVSIAMKELFPPGNAEYKAENLDFILSVRGKQFADLIPSLNDDLASISIYQHTDKSVNGLRKTGASAMNSYLPKEMRIPGSIIFLEGWDHEKATHLNGLAGIADMLSRTNSKEDLNYLENIPDEDLLVLYAGIHHRPRDAKKGVKLWAANNAEFPLTRSLNRRLTDYSVQVRDNKIGLEAYLSKQKN